MREMTAKMMSKWMRKTAYVKDEEAAKPKNQEHNGEN